MHLQIALPSYAGISLSHGDVKNVTFQWTHVLCKSSEDKMIKNRYYAHLKYEEKQS